MKVWPAPGTAVRPSTIAGRDGSASLDVVAVLVEHRPHPAVAGAGDDRVADAQRAALDQHRGHRAATAVEVRLDDEALGVLVRVGPQVQGRVGGQDDGLEQLVEVELGLGRDVDEHRVAAVLLGHQAVLGELAADLGRVRVRLVDLVDRDHDRYAGGLGVVERLDRLRHHAVVGRDHEDRDVGRLGTTRTHGGERLVTRGVDEGDPALVAVDLGGDLVGTDVLGDATGLLVDHVGVAERVEQLGLSVVDVTHDGHDRRTDDQVGLVALVLTELEVEGLEQLAVLVLGRDDLDDVVELLAEQLERRVVDRLGRGDHLAEAEQHLDELGRVDADPVGEVGQGRAAREPDGLAVALADAHAADRRGLHGLELLATGPLRLAATARRTARATEGTLGLAALAGTTATGTTAAAGAEATGTAAGSTGTGARGATTTGRTGTAGSPAGAAATGRHREPTGATGATTPPGPPPKAAGDFGIIAGLGRGMPGRPGRRTRRTVAVDVAVGRAAGARAAAHALAGRERVVAGARRAGTARRARRRGAGPWCRRLVGGGRLRGGRAPRRAPRRPRPGSRRPRGSGSAGASAAFLAGAFLGPGFAAGASAGASAAGAGDLAASSASPYSFLNFISTGSSMVEEGDLTNSPSSFSFSRTSLLSMP